MIETRSNLTFDDVNRGILVGDGVAAGNQVDGGGFAVGANTVLNVSNRVSGAGEFIKDYNGELRLSGDMSQFGGKITVFQGLMSMLSTVQARELSVKGTRANYNPGRLKLVGSGAHDFVGWQANFITIETGGKLDLVDYGV